MAGSAVDLTGQTSVADQDWESKIELQAKDCKEAAPPATNAWVLQYPDSLMVGWFEPRPKATHKAGHGWPGETSPVTNHPLFVSSGFVRLVSHGWAWPLARRLVCRPHSCPDFRIQWSTGGFKLTHHRLHDGHRRIPPYAKEHVGWGTRHSEATAFLVPTPRRQNLTGETPGIITRADRDYASRNRVDHPHFCKGSSNTLGCEW